MKVNDAAKSLGISRATLYKKAKNFIKNGMIDESRVETLKALWSKENKLTLHQRVEEIHKVATERNIKERVVELLEEYAKKHQKNPTKLYLRKQDEIEILKLNANDIGYEAVSAITCNGARGINKLLGLEIVWGSKNFNVGNAKEMVLMEINKIKEKGGNCLHLCNTSVDQLPAEVAKLTNLKEIALSDNQLTQIPSEIGQLISLEEIDLSDNQLTKLPSEIGQLTNLKELNLYNNRLTHLPAEIEQLVNLKFLTLGANQLTHLPAGFRKLASLKRLALHKNQLNQNIINNLKKALPNCQIYSDFG